MRITGIETTKRGRHSIFVDGEFLFSMHPDVFYSAGLAAGAEVGIERLEQLRCESELRTAKYKALQLLSYRSYSRRQLTERLARSCDPAAAEQAAERMQELGLIDDTIYAGRLARDLYNLKGYSPRRIRQELLHRGIESYVADAALTQFEDEATADKLVELILQKHSRKLGDTHGEQKVIAALARLGYNYSDIRTALREALAQLDIQRDSEEYYD